MDFATIGSALVAGGLAGPVVTLLWGNSLVEKREYNKWVSSERHKLYSELLSVITKNPKEPNDISRWTYEIRDISQRIHILFENGTAPRELNSSMEAIFKFAQDRKSFNDSNKQEIKAWEEELRVETRKLRKHMSDNIRVK